MTFNFSIPNRYSNDLADHGVWLDLAYEDGTEIGEFKLKFFDTSGGQRAQLLQKRIQAKYAASALKKMKGDEFAKVLMLDEILIDWKIKDAKGKDVPYSREAAEAYFAHENAQWVLDQLAAFASDVRNYREERPFEEIAKN